MVAVARVRAVGVVVGGRLWRWSLWRGLVVWLRRWLRVCFGARAGPGAGALQFWKQGQCFVSMLFPWQTPTAGCPNSRPFLEARPQRLLRSSPQSKYVQPWVARRLTQENAGFYATCDHAG